jgi:hypothetical protein
VDEAVKSFRLHYARASIKSCKNPTFPALVALISDGRRALGDLFSLTSCVMASYRKSSRTMPARPKTCVTRRKPGQPRVRDLRKLPWWCDEMVVRLLPAAKVRLA